MATFMWLLLATALESLLAFSPVPVQAIVLSTEHYGPVCEFRILQFGIGDYWAESRPIDCGVKR